MSDGMTHKRTVEVDADDVRDVASAEAGRANPDEVQIEHEPRSPRCRATFGRRLPKAKAEWSAPDGQHEIVVPPAKLKEVVRRLEPAHDDEELVAYEWTKRGAGEIDAFRLTYKQVERDLPAETDDDSPDTQTDKQAPSMAKKREGLYLMGFGACAGSALTLLVWAIASGIFSFSLIGLVLAGVGHGCVEQVT